MVRVVAAIVLGLLALTAILLLPGWGIDALILIVVLGGLVEFGRMFLADRVERWAMVLLGLCVAVAMLVAPSPAETAVWLLAMGLFAIALLFMRRAGELSGIAERLGLAMLGVVYLGAAFPFWGWIARMDFGREFILMALLPACLCDSFALGAGKAFGRHKFAPMVSPNKTMEGFAGALVGSLAGTFLIRWWLLPQVGILEAAGLALVIWITSPFGDLVESMLKRSCGVKDSGAIIPGHGGVLDRLDALVFTAPATYLYLKLALGM